MSQFIKFYLDKITTRQKKSYHFTLITHDSPSGADCLL